MRLLVHHLKERGCENAAILTIDPASTSSLGDRAEGFYKGLEETRMCCAGEHIMPPPIATPLLMPTMMQSRSNVSPSAVMRMW